MSVEARRKVRDLVLPTPKTPATAKVDLPALRASARLAAIETICPLSCRAAVPRATAKLAAWGQLYCQRSAAGRGRASSAKGLPCIPVDTEWALGPENPALWVCALQPSRPFARGGRQ